MKIIRHRINTIEELALIDNEYGIEIDLRSQNGEIILSHDPYPKDSIRLVDWLKFYRHNNLVLNVKEEGLEQKVLELMDLFAIQEFFFLDQSFPFMIKTLKSGESKVAMRFSDHESFDNILKILNLKFPQPSWVWVDSFSGDWSHLSDLETIKSLGFKACLASPELHGRNLELELKVIKEFIENHPFEAVCTKLPEKWLAI